MAHDERLKDCQCTINRIDAAASRFGSGSEGSGTARGSG